MSDEMVTLPKTTVQALIDMALYGDAACSGHLDDEEVLQLRSAAEAIGMDPNEATPQNFRCKHRGSHAMGDWFPAVAGRETGLQRRRCQDCRQAWEERPTPTDPNKTTEPTGLRRG